MSTLSQFTTQRVTKSVIHGTSTTGTGPQSGLYTASAREVLAAFAAAELPTPCRPSSRSRSSRFLTLSFFSSSPVGFTSALGRSSAIAV